MKIRTSMIILLGLLITISSRECEAAEVIDQSFTETFAEGASLINSINACCPSVAQTFTAAIGGKLTGLRLGVSGAVDVRAGEYSSAPLRVRVYEFLGDFPGTNLLGEATLTAGPLAPLDVIIRFPEPFAITEGSQYAIVVDYPGARLGIDEGLWTGAFAEGLDYYPYGSPAVFDGVNWRLSEGDLHFVTYVQPTPIAELVPCAGPREGTNWLNHGQYVAAVVGAIQRYYSIGALTRAEAIATIRTAARADCGY